MIPHARRKAKQQAIAGKGTAEREVTQQIALAVSLARRKAEREAGEPIDTGLDPVSDVDA